MANLNHFGKSGSDWTLNNLNSYHISLNQLDPLAHDSQNLPQASVDPELLTNIDATSMQ
ncbi:hypothetical protein BDN71DRAFT_1368493, partial [Pleurotus eryngii]